MNKTLAIMKHVGIGMRDARYPCLWFHTYISEGVGALQVLPWPDAEKLIRDTGVYEVKSLEGRACWVEEAGGLIRFVGAWKQ